MMKARDIVDDIMQDLNHLITEHERCLPPLSHIEDKLERLKRVVNAENYGTLGEKIKDE